MFTPDLLANKVIVITGGGSGLGLAMAKRFCELGAAVAICGRTEEKLVKAKVELEKTGARVFATTADVREYEQVKDFFNQTVAALGGIDALVNNAAGNFYSPSESLSPRGFSTVVDIVLRGSFHCAHALGNYAIEAKRPASILNIVTTYTETGSSFVLPSACAKAGVYAMTTSLAYEWACYNIRVNAIAPGPFPTEGAWARLMPDSSFEDSYRARHPMGRFGKPEELANLASFLLSDGASYINGECVNIDGGERLQGGQFNFIAQSMPRENLKAIFSQMKEKANK